MNPIRPQKEKKKKKETMLLYRSFLLWRLVLLVSRFPNLKRYQNNRITYRYFVGKNESQNFHLESFLYNAVVCLKDHSYGKHVNEITNIGTHNLDQLHYITFRVKPLFLFFLVFSHTHTISFEQLSVTIQLYFVPTNG